MGETTGIEWTDATWNPWYGCHKVSQGCKNCYMFREQKQYGRDPNVISRSKTRFNDPLKWKEPKRIFTCSWSDWFIEEADPWRAEAWEIVRKTPRHTYLILTKRPENIPGRLPDDWGNGYHNVWLGVSAEDQATANLRIPQLTKIPAVIRFVSCEPLLGPIDLYTATGHDHHIAPEFSWIKNKSIHWLIIGGESGPDCRPMDVEWAKHLVRQCERANTACFVKQLGGWPDKQTDQIKFPEELRVREFPTLFWYTNGQSIFG